MIEEFCKKSGSFYIWECVENVNVTLLVIVFLSSIIWIFGTVALFYEGRKDIKDGDIVTRKTGLQVMLISPVWPVVVLIYFVQYLCAGVVNLFRDIRDLKVDIREEKEAEKTRILEQAMVELEEMKQEEHEDWMRKFNSIGAKE